MIKIINFFENLIFAERNIEGEDDFADFFLRAKPKDKKILFKRVIRKANKDQKKYLDRYERSQVGQK